MILQILREAHKLNFDFLIIRDKISVNETLFLDKGDIDIFIRKDQRTDFIKFIGKKGYYNFDKGNTYKSISNNIFLDVHSGIYTRMPFISENIFFNNKRIIDEIPFASNEVLFLTLLFHPFDIIGVRGRRDYTPNKKNFLLNNKKLIKSSIVKSFIIDTFGKKNYYNLLDFFQNCKSENDINDLNKFYLGLKLSSYKKINTYYFIFNRYFFAKIKSLFSKNDYSIIAIVGVDGSGKTTLSDSLKNQLLNFNISSKQVYLGSLGGYLLPFEFFRQIFVKIFGKENDNNIKINSIKNDKIIQQNKVKLKKISLSIFLFFEYIFRSIKINYYYYFTKNIVIYDRYISDYYRGDIDNSILGIIKYLIKKPKIILFIYGDTQNYYNRKKEYTTELLKSHQDNMKEGLVKNFKNELVVIDGNQTKDKLLSDALHIIHIYNL